MSKDKNKTARNWWQENKIKREIYKKRYSDRDREWKHLCIAIIERKGAIPCEHISILGI
jgi:hypothetical protein